MSERFVDVQYTRLLQNYEMRRVQGRPKDPMQIYSPDDEAPLWGPDPKVPLANQHLEALLHGCLFRMTEVPGSRA